MERKKTMADLLPRHSSIIYHSIAGYPQVTFPISLDSFNEPTHSTMHNVTYVSWLTQITAEMLESSECIVYSAIANMSSPAGHTCSCSALLAI